MLSVLVLAVGLIATLALSRTIRAHEHSEVRWVTRIAGHAVRSDVVTDMNWQMVGLDRLALLWEAASDDTPGELWMRNAQLYLQHRPGSVAVEWLTPEAEARVLITKSGNRKIPLAFGGVPKALLAAVSDSGAAMMSEPTLVSGGRWQWAIALPVHGRDRFRGFIVSFFDLQECWDYILDDLKELGFSYALVLPNQAEHLLPGSSREHEQDWGEVVDIVLPGVKWQVRVWPKSSVVNIVKSRLADVTLLTGSTLSLLLALTLHFAFGAARSSARTRQANDALQREITMREGAQEELRRAHAELEMRIDQRTADLAGANALLQREAGEHRRAEESLRELTGRLFHLQDQERRRLARELHDGTVQDLVALKMDVRLIRDAIHADDRSTKELVDECVRLIDKATGELRTISYLLHPPFFDELGLAPALRDLVDGFVARSGVQVTLDIDPTMGRFGHELELAIYRVVQEALSNVYRHAQSRTASIALARDAEFVRLEIADAGRGIAPELLAPNAYRLAGVGIAGMRERVRLLGGQLEIQSSCSGTLVRAVLPAVSSLPSAPAA